jgi:hypothetical protein
MPKHSTETRKPISKQALARKVSFRTDKIMAKVLAQLPDPDAFIRAAVLARLIPASDPPKATRRKK